MITLRTLYCVPSEITNVRSISPGLSCDRVTGATLRLEKAVGIVIVDELLAVVLEHLGVILAETRPRIGFRVLI